MNTVYNVSYKDRIKKQEIQEEVLVDFTYLYVTKSVLAIDIMMLSYV